MNAQVLSCFSYLSSCPSHKLTSIASIPVKALFSSESFRLFRKQCIEGASGRSTSKLCLTWNHNHSK